MKFTKKTMALMTAAALSAPLSNASADVIASAVIEFTDFRLFGSTDSGTSFTQLDVSDFSTLDFTSTADADATLLADTESFSNASDSGSNGIDFPTVDGGAVQSPNPNDICVGDCAGTLIGATQNDNEFQHIVFGDLTGESSYAWSDQLETGSPISGQTDDAGNPVTANADVANSSYSYLDSGTSGNGGANSDNGLNSDFTFALNNDQDFIELEFSVDAFSYVLATGDETNPFAAASTLYFLNLTNTAWNPVIGGVVIPINLNSLTDGLAVSTQTPGDTKTGTIGPTTLRFRSTNAFVAGNLETFTARLESSVEVRRAVPEPSILGLIGLSMLGFGVAKWRRKQNA